MTDTEPADAVQRLTAIHEIHQLKARYFRLLDAHDWDAFRELFTDDLTLDIAESTSRPDSPDTFVAALRRHLDDAVTVHQGHMPEIEILGPDSASGIWAMSDRVEPAVTSGYPSFTGYGHYHETYRRVGGRWLISSLRLTRLARTERPRGAGQPLD
jgi:hypothetical protein